MFTAAAFATAAALLAASIPRTDAHGYMLIPESQFNGDKTSAWVVEIAPLWDSDGWDGNNEGSVTTFNSLKSANNFVDLKTLMDSSELGAECGFTNPSGTPQPIPSDGKATFSRAMQHVGPCEIWLDGTMAFSAENCVDMETFPVDYSSSPKEMRYYWLAFQGVDGKTVWQSYKGCIPLEGSGGGTSQSSPSTSSSTGDSTSQQTTQAPSSGNSDTPSSGNSDTPSSENSDTPSSEDSNTPSSENSDTPSSENSDTPSSENSDTPSSEDSNTPSNESSDTPSSNDSNSPSSGNSDSPSSEKSDSPSSETTQAPSSGNWGTPSSGGWGTPSTPSSDDSNTPSNDDSNDDSNTPSSGDSNSPATVAPSNEDWSNTQQWGNPSTNSPSTNQWESPSTGEFYNNNNNPSSGGWGQSNTATQAPSSDDSTSQTQLNLRGRRLRN
ncbi:hypothetical protein PHYBOEH_004640 [Phytophthora boehmeriae]|uniref:Uncharacterized protein n=1 Tax=Phytophthora boehmeriae TaxID=109152 RepID=A0A8T1WR46_9STRA|nr:hypothetical protein PHYBOEH_004640 [Phytophthora boehmeriae]